MKMKWVYIIFSILIIVGIGIGLIFIPKDKDADNSNDDVPSDIEEDVEEETIYATSFLVNLPSTIALLKGTQAKLLSGYIVVTPSEMMNKISVELKPRYNSDVFGLEFSNNILTAKETGSYNLTFSVQKTEKTKYSQTVLIVVHDEQENSHIYQINNSITESETKNLSEYFTINSELGYSFITDDKLEISNNLISAISVGTSNLVINLIDNYVSYFYNFEITIKQLPQYYFSFENVENNTINISLSDNSVYFIYYSILDKEEGDVSQAVTYSPEDETIVTVLESLNPTIKIKALKPGETILTLKCVADENVSEQITIIVTE